MSNPKVSLIIPAYREEAMIDATLTEVEFWMNEHEYQDMIEVVVAVQGDDRTGEIAASHKDNFRHFQLLESSKAGKGRNIAHGMHMAKGEYKIFTDADLATPLHHVPVMIEHLEAGDNICIGIRDIRNMHDGIMRRWSSRLSNLLIRFLAAPGIPDTQCGFKGFRAEAAERIFSQLTIYRWGFDFEVLAMARGFGYRISTMKIDDWSDPKGEHGLSGESQTAVMMKTLRELFKVRMNLWRKIYK